VDVIRFARAVRLLRRRRGWRQTDLAAAARLSRGALARIEQGHADRVTVITLERLLAPLGARLRTSIDWNGEALDRLLDAAHAGLVDAMLQLLGLRAWLCAPEVSFNLRGERGSIDVLAWHPASGALLVVEVKSVVPDLQATLMALDRKTRLGREVARDRGWTASQADRLLVLPEDRTARRRVQQHEATFATALPDRGPAVRRWIRDPSTSAAFAGLLFLSAESGAIARHRMGRGRTSAPLGTPRRF